MRKRSVTGVVAGLGMVGLGVFLLATSIPAGGSPVAQADYLTADLWNDGKAEVAFYRVERDFDQYGQPVPQSFLVGTYLVKHDFDPARGSKAPPDSSSGSTVSAFKWAAFYEFESDNSYQYKRAYVVNAAQRDLAPLKSSYTSFDWCSNQYWELSFPGDGKAHYLMRSDDYGNTAASYEAPEGAYPVELVPLLVRALDFTSSSHQGFDVLLEDGTLVPARATLVERERVETWSGPREAERIEVRYEDSFRSWVSRRSEPLETYWRDASSDRAILEMESASYRMELVEKLRSAYWEEDVYSRLERVKERP